ncbi:nucleotide exchange factor GrpE [Solimonas sp. K1W22B-7]|uniref:nucleotide exchange factor GrpE n=1 Tax=Solimonas sp. K1W22B-7 TaxID=2303331 RepID=UPI000E32FEE5|nr:nucleotide exchange factor GrpE [Solimonas sp. K1W22B-7]AXQ29268.1 nucleotide exchange factor GrpE [Solimonas sp. K1W22B-7]
MTATPETQAPTDELPSDPNAEIAALSQELEQARAEAAAARDAQLRAAADLENTRRRLERDAASSLKFANERLLGDLLAVADSLELGLKAADGDAAAKAMADGMQLTYRQLMAVLEKHGVKVVDPTGQPFNPDHHQAMTMAESAELPPNHVVSTLQKGYLLQERLLRPAMVVVSRAPAA